MVKYVETFYGRHTALTLATVFVDVIYIVDPPVFICITYSV